MATQEIIAAIDEYIGQLREARRLLISVSTLSHSQKRTKKMAVMDEAPASAQTGSSAPSISPAPVAIRVIPPVMPRQSRVKKKTTLSAAPVSEKFAAQGPVIVRPSEITQNRRSANQGQPLTDAAKDQGTINHLDELAKEVRRRMAANMR